MDTLHRGTYSSCNKYVSFHILPEEMRKCKIQLYDTNGKVKFVPDFNPRSSRPVTSDSEYWPPVASSRKIDKKTKYLFKVARDIQAGIHHIHNKKEAPKSETETKESSEHESNSTLDVVQNKPMVIKRRRTVHGVPSVDEKPGLIEIEVPSQGQMSTSTQISQMTDQTDESRRSDPNRGRLISITTSQPHLQNRQRVSEGESEKSDSDCGESLERVDLAMKNSSDVFSTLEENNSDDDNSTATSVDACAERQLCMKWDKIATRFRTRKLKYGKSYHNLIQQNVRKTSRDKAESECYKRQRTLRRVRSFGDFNEQNEFRTFRPLYKFRRAVRTVIVMIKAGTSTSQTPQRSERQTLSWTQVHDEAGTSRRAYERFGLTFDPSVFRANREVQLSNESKAILSMDPCDRTEEQLHLSLANLKQAVDAFGEFPLKMQKSLVRVGWYEHFERKRVIIRQGHQAENFYFILSGTAVVTVLETNKVTGEQYGYTVAVLRKGNSFGELALMHGARRSATVTCKNDVELLAVGRQDFIDIFMNVETNREPDHIRFLRSIDTFQGWPFDVLPYNDPKICIYTYFRRGVLLCKDSNNTDWIYIIVTGSCRVLKSLYATQPHFEKFNSSDRNKMYNDFNRFSSISLPVSARDTPEECVPRSLLRSRLGIRNEKKTGRKRQAVTCLPVIRNRSQEELQQSAEEHIRQLDEMLGERDSLIDLFNEIPHRKKHYDSDEKEKVFVQIQKLGPKEIYGMEQVVFSMMGSTTNTSLVSEGAECVLINRKFFLQHLTENTAKRIRKMVQPIPSDESLQQKLQNKANWEAYKSLTVTEHLVYKKHLQDFLNL